ncbi:MAG: hypothetical protein ABI281_07310 [Caldimonas sp.]
MTPAGFNQRHRALAVATFSAALFGLSSCGGGAGSPGSETASGTDKTYLSVDASDADGDALQYQWRVTGGTIDNKNAKQTVWTLPPGRGIHFAYVAVSDGKGGWVEQQYAVSTDELDSDTPARAPISREAPAVVDVEGATNRLRIASPDATRFKPEGGGSAVARTVYLPDVQVQVVEQATGTVAFAGTTDLSGELDLPKLVSGRAYKLLCTTRNNAPLAPCGNFTASSEALVRNVAPALTDAQNLRLHGHVALAEGAVCGHENAFFNVETAATVQLQQVDGTALGAPIRVNRYGDYQVSASVPVRGALKLAVQCEGYAALLDVPAPVDAAGYIAAAPIELSHAIANASPRIVKMVANGSDGNVRGRMIEPGAGTGSGIFPGASHFLTYKGVDTKLSACLYYRALGAVADCDSQGNPIQPISFTDWKTKNGFGTAADVSAKYINQNDLNLVRFMTATRNASGGIAFYVCNTPGPDSSSQHEVDQFMEDALGNRNRVACVTMEYTPVAGANGGQPFTKFFTFAPDGSLLLSINLDGRGEKYMPGSCVACHGGSTYSGRFPEQKTASPFLGSGFLPFDTGNYLFGSRASLTEAAQSEAFYQLNALVKATEPDPGSATSKLIDGWYAAGHVLDKAYVPPAWKAADIAAPGAAKFYRNVIGISCRTCHVSLGAKFDWDSVVLTPSRASTQFCGGTSELALNASMPQALISSDQLFTRIRADADLATLVEHYLGCSAPKTDPAYARH